MYLLQAFVLLFIKRDCTEWWWRMLLIPALSLQRQVDLCELEVSLVYKSQFQGQASELHRETPTQNKTKQTKKKLHLKIIKSCHMIELVYSSC